MLLDCREETRPRVGSVWCVARPLAVRRKASGVAESSRRGRHSRFDRLRPVRPSRRSIILRPSGRRPLIDFQVVQPKRVFMVAKSKDWPSSLEDVARELDRLRRRGFVFLLGAGASAEAGVMTSTDMVSALLKRFQSDRDLRKLLRVLTKGLGRHPNIEDLLVALDVVIDRSSCDGWPLVREWHFPLASRRAGAWAAELAAYIRRRLFGWLKQRRSSAYLAGLYDFSAERRGSSEPRVTNVFTLNYDLTVENACRAAGIRCWTGFAANNDEPVAYSTWERRLLTQRGLRLHKLHGSVNWGIRVEKPTDDEPTDLIAVKNWLWDQKAPGPFRWPSITRADSIRASLVGPVQYLRHAVRSHSGDGLRYDKEASSV